VIALDEELRLAEHANIDPGGALPWRLRPVECVPLDDVAYAATFLFIKPLFCSRKMGRG
jgi:hypothetical protein